MKAEKPKSWRDIWKVHPAADLFPMLPQDELKKLGEDIKQRGLEEPITLWSEDKESDVYLLDGRNRLDAMELVGMETFYEYEGEYHVKAGDFHRWVSAQERRYSIDPYALAISRNIHRRHLTKEQKADLIVQVMMKAEEAKKTSQSIARSFSPEKGKRGGSTKDDLKQKIVEEGKNQGIGKRNIEKALAKNKGPTQKTAREKKPPKTDFEATVKASEKMKPGDALTVVAKVIKFLEREMATASRKDVLVFTEVFHQDFNSFLRRHGVEEIVTLLEFKKLQADLALAKLQLNTLNSLFQISQPIKGMDPDRVKLRRDFQKKYHPDLNPNKTFTATEVMADFNSLLNGITRA
jgi:hypothetical protein